MKKKRRVVSGARLYRRDVRVIYRARGPFRPARLDKVKNRTLVWMRAMREPPEVGSSTLERYYFFAAPILERVSPAAPRLMNNQCTSCLGRDAPPSS